MRGYKAGFPRPRSLLGHLVHAQAMVYPLQPLCAVPAGSPHYGQFIVEQHDVGCRTLWFTAEDVDCMACIAAGCSL